MASRISPPPFRAIAIAGSESQVDIILDAASRYPDVAIGLLLRDPHHVVERVKQLAEHALHTNVTNNVELITSSCVIAGVARQHFRSAQMFEELPADHGSAFGFSTHTFDDVVRAQNIGAQYCLHGPIFSTASKPGTEPIGVDALRELCAHKTVTIPVFALGGISAGTMRACFDSGAFGVAGISLFSTREQCDESLQQIRAINAETEE